MLKTKLLPCQIALLLTSCVATGSIDSYCQFAHPIYVEKGDRLTPDTSREILTHDEFGRAKCGWDKV